MLNVYARLARLKRKRKKRIEINKLKNGNEVTCPICKSSFKAFAPYGSKQRENACCHTCGSLERDRLIFLFSNKKFDLYKKDQATKKILHFAPEKSFYDIFSVLETLDYTPCDLEPEIYDFANKQTVKKVDITAIPFDDNSFDFILCNHVLEHVPDDQLAMSELYRVMKTGGNGIFQVPIDYQREITYEDWSITLPEERVKAFGQRDHVRWYGQDYKTRLEKAGFKVTEDDFVNQLSLNEQRKLGLMASELIYHCQK